jgi:Flp pilus assembly protein TadG
MSRRHHHRRTGALAVEGAIVYSVLLVLLLALLVGGIGVFRYQQVACLAREGARWSAVHGQGWESDSKQPPCTQDDIRKNAVLPFAAGMDPAAVAVQVEFVDRVAGTISNWDSVTHPPTSTDGMNNTVTNRVRVTVNYQWVPGALLVGPLYLKSTSEMTIWN